MNKYTMKIDGMVCTMCEAHIKDVIRKVIPSAKKVAASHTKGKASFLSEEAVDERRLQEAIAATGYDCTSIRSEAYQKKGLFR